RKRRREWSRKILIHLVGFTMCATILAVTIFEKFAEGGWITLAITCAVIGACFLIRRHYRAVSGALERSFSGLEQLPPGPGGPAGPLDPAQPTAVLLVGGYNGFGIHTMLNVFRAFPGHFKNVVFLSVGVIDSGRFKGEDSAAQVRAETQGAL